MSPIVPPELLERERETRVLRDAVVDACAGRARAIVVTGPAGCGRTRLLGAAADLATGRHVRVLRACGGPGLAGSPFGLVRALVDLDDARAPAPEETAARVHGFHRLAVGLTGAGAVLLVLDDLHLADPASVHAVAHLVRRIRGVRGLPLLVVASACTPAAAPAATAGALDELLGVPGVELLEPAALSPAAVRTWAGAELGAPPHPETVEVCVRVTGGNPQRVAGVLAHLAGQADARLDPVARVRDAAERLAARSAAAVLCHEPPEVREAAYAMAVLGDDAAVDSAALVSGLDPVTVTRAAERLGVLGLPNDGCRFRFASVCSAVLDAVPDDDRLRAYARAGRVLETLAAPVERVAEQFLKAGAPSDEGVVELLHTAATRVGRHGDPAFAAALLDHALAGTVSGRGRADLLVDLAIAERGIAPAAAYGHLVEAVSLLDSARDRGGVLAHTAPFLCGLDAAGMTDLLEHGLHELGADERAGVPETAGDRELRYRLEALLVYARSEDRDQLGPVWDWVDGTDPDGCLDGGAGAAALRAAHLFFSALGLRVDAAEVAVRTRGILTGELDDDEMLQPIRMGAMGLMSWTDTGEDIAASYQRVLDDARRRQWSDVYAILRGVRAIVHLRRGRVPESLDDARASLAVQADQMRGEARLMALYTAALALVELDRPEEAGELVRSGIPEGASDRTWRWCWVLDARAAVLAATGRTREALDQARETGRLLVEAGIVNPAVLGWQARTALLHHELGEHAAALAAAEEHLELCRRWGTHGHVGGALRVLGVVQGGRRGLATLRAAMAELAESPQVLERARCLVDMGVLTRSTGTDAAARALLRGGLDLAEEFGARMLATRARAELRAAGGRSRRSGSSLTPAEAEVARLAAGGARNRDIARTLFVTQRAVELHLTRCYRKLGITGRAELAAALRRHDLVRSAVSRSDGHPAPAS